MNIAVAIPNHNQHELVRTTIRKLMDQSITPATIYVLSDGKPFWKLPGDPDCVIPINNAKKFTGRCGNRNSVIEPFLNSQNDAIVFMDGDCSPIGGEFLEKYEKLFSRYSLVFGTRTHSVITGLATPPSDLLTANMDNLYSGAPLDYTDLRVVSGAVKAWQESTNFNEKLDLMLTGMIGWSCNFGFTKSGLRKLTKFQKATYGMTEGIFDSGAFKDGWGYEDVAMGIDALYACLDIGVTDCVQVLHRSHDRSDGLFDHVKGRHAIMERYRGLEHSVKMKDLIYKAAILASAFFTAGLITGLVTETINLLNMIGY